MDKNTRKSDIGFMTIVAALAKQCIEKPGVCGVGYYLDKRKGPGLHYVPGVHLTAETFLEYFGEDTDFEYRETGYGDVEMVTEVNGVTFYALINSTDRIESGVPA